MKVSFLAIGVMFLTQKGRVFEAARSFFIIIQAGGGFWAEH
jgi:hypothetical protein